ncbi:MAG: DUF4360 domain-containing protein [Bdellovibrionales bacterium]
MKKYLLATLAAALFSANVYADDIRLGEPSYGGSGCPAGTASVSMGFDQKSISVLFDQYLAMAGAGTGLQLDRKSCNLAIPVHVPQGYSISVFEVDYRGYAAVPRGASGLFQVEYFFAGQRGPRAQRSFMGPYDRDFNINHGLAAEALVWSNCGEDVILRVNSSIMARSNRQMDDVLMSIDSADVQSRLVYHVQWRRCR